MDSPCEEDLSDIDDMSSHVAVSDGNPTTSHHNHTLTDLAAQGLHQAASGNGGNNANSGSAKASISNIQ